MNLLATIFAVVAALSLAVAGYAWWHASRWAQLIAYARIVVEYKGKVKIDAPLQEWALWCRQTGKDKAQPQALRGHVMYALGGTRIALFIGKKHAKVRPVKPRPGHQGRQIREGTWSKGKQTQQTP